MRIASSASPHLRPNLLRTDCNQRALEAQVALIGLAAKVLADAGLFVTSGRNDEIRRTSVPIDPNGPNLQRSQRTQRAVQVARIHACCESILRVVCQSE